MELLDYTKLKPGSATKLRTLKSKMTSWRTVHASISDMKDTPSNLETLSLLLGIEATEPSLGRQQIMSRLHMRINGMRQRLEYNKLLRYVKR